MNIPHFKLICIEGADKTGKTTLSNFLRKFDNTIYKHFTVADKQCFSEFDIPMIKNMNVFYQTNAFFEQTFLTPTQLDNNIYVLDRTPIYSDMVYSPLYRKDQLDLHIRKPEFNYFNMVLSALDCIVIFANNSNWDMSYKLIEQENEGWIASKREYFKLREKYIEVMNLVKKTSSINIVEYDFNMYSNKIEPFINEQVIPYLEKCNTNILNKTYKKCESFNIFLNEIIQKEFMNIYKKVI